ncbi:MAG: hypothetical protein ABSG06_01300 [Methanoregula sp.]|jgi:hypothetical protein
MIRSSPISRNRDSLYAGLNAIEMGKAVRFLTFVSKSQEPSFSPSANLPGGFA